MRTVLLAGASCLLLGLTHAASAQTELGAALRSYTGIVGTSRGPAPAAAGAAGVTGAEVGGAAAVGPAAAGGGATSGDQAPGRVTGTLPGGVTPDRALGQNVHGPKGEVVGEIEDVLIDDAGAITAVVLDVGGLLGLGERQVAVPVAALRPVADADGGASGGAGESGGAAGVTGAAGVGAGTGAGARDVDTTGASADRSRGRPQLALGMGEDELRRLPEYRREGGMWVRQGSSSGR